MADRSRFSTWRLEPLTFTSWAISITVRPLEVCASGSAPFCNNMRTVSSSPSTTATWIGDSNSVRGKALHALQWISPAALRSFIAEKLNFLRKFWTCFSFTCSNIQAAVWPCTISSSVRLLKTDSTPAANMAFHAPMRRKRCYKAPSRLNVHSIRNEEKHPQAKAILRKDCEDSRCPRLLRPFLPSFIFLPS